MIMVIMWTLSLQEAGAKGYKNRREEKAHCASAVECD